MKRTTILTLALGVTLLLAACGSNGASTAEPTLDDLTVEYACGYGFYLSNPDQTVGMFISTNRPDVPTVSDLVSDGIWSTEVHIGKDLFANWCDDVIEPDEPEPMITDRWSLGAGTISIGDVPTECVGEPVTATLSDVVVLTSTGAQIELETIEVTNTGWGCFAG